LFLKEVYYAHQGWIYNQKVICWYI